MANRRISKDKRALILHLLVEGNTVSGICRILNVGKNNVLRFLSETGEACEDWHDANFIGIEIDRLAVDEQWGYVGKHRERITRQHILEDTPDGLGDCWLWAAIDPESKAAIAWTVGRHNRKAADELVSAIDRRVDGEFSITSDPYRLYEPAIRRKLGDRVDYAAEKKIFGIPEDAPRWLKKPVNRLLGVEREAVHSNPDLNKSTVCHVERFFLTVRQGNKRCARKTLAYSKKWENHRLVMSIHLFLCNMCRKHQTTKQTPAQALGIADKAWSLLEVVEMADAHRAEKKAAKAESKRKAEDTAFEKAFAEKYSQ